MPFDFQHLWAWTEGHGGLIVHDSQAKLGAGHEEAWKLIRGDYRPDEPIVYEYLMGSKPLDLIATSYPARHLLSDRIVQALKANNFTGWRTYPVRVFGKDKQEIPGYHGFSITGKAGPADWSRSEKFQRQFRARASPYLRGLYFAEETWDRSDIFIPEGTGYICIVQPVYQALLRLRPTNVEFQPLTEILAPA